MSDFYDVAGQKPNLPLVFKTLPEAVADEVARALLDGVVGGLDLTLPIDGHLVVDRYTKTAQLECWILAVAGRTVGRFIIDRGLAAVGSSGAPSAKKQKQASPSTQLVLDNKENRKRAALIYILSHFTIGLCGFFFN